MEHLRGQERELAVKAVRIGLAVGLIAVLFAVFRPFFSIMAWSAILSYALHPLYKRVLRLTRGRRDFSALVMCLVLTVGFILPILSLSLLLADELTRTSRMVATFIATHEGLVEGGWRDLPLIAPLVARIEDYERFAGKDVRSVLAENLTELGGVMVQQVTLVATNVLLGLFELGFILLCTYYFLRDGEALLGRIQNLLPFSPQRQQLVARRFDEVVTGSIYGNAMVSIMVGIVGGLSFWAVSLHGPVLWGTVMGILAYLPAIGTAVVWIPAVIYLFVKGAYVKTVILCAAGALMLVIDHVVRNVLVGSQVQLHPLLVLFSVLGGVKLFGLLGLIAGPLAVAFGMTILEEYRSNPPAQKQTG